MLSARRRSLFAALLLLAASIALLFTFRYELIYDYPNTGDETMSLTQALNAARTRVPSYGQLADGQPWTLGPITLPVYFFIYGPAAAASSPLMRLPVARAVSRVLMGAALFFWLLALVRAWRRRESNGAADRVVVGLAVVAVLWLFLFVEVFTFIASCARVDAAGFLAESIFLLLAVELAERPSERRLFATGAAAIAAVFTSFLAGALCGAASVALFVGYVSRAPRSRRKFLRALGVGGAVAAMGAALFVIFNFVILRVPLTGHQNSAFSSELAGIGLRARHLIPRPSDLWVELTRYASQWLYPAAVAACLLLFGWRWHRRRRDPTAPPDGARFGTVAGLALSSALAVHFFFISPRHVYGPLVFGAVALPLLVTLVRARGQAAVRVTLALLFLVGVVIWLPMRLLGMRPIDVLRAPHASFALQRRRTRDAEVGHAATNRRRDNQLRALFGYLSQHQITRALVTDPLFALLDNEHHQFDFVYDPDIDDQRELELIERFVGPSGVGYLVSTPFGDSGWLHTLGTPRLKQALVAARPTIEPDVVEYPGGARVRFTRVFETDSMTDRNVYIYGDAPSTPFWLYRLDLFRPPAN